MEFGKVDLSIQESEAKTELNNYINNRIADVRFYLRGINYNKLNSTRAVEGLSDPIDILFNEKILIGNKENIYRLLLDKFVYEIRIAYDNLIAYDLEFANNKKEVEESISKFEIKIKELTKKFRDKVLYTYSKETGYSINNMSETNIGEINVKIRKRKDKISQDELHEKKELYELREIVTILSILMDYIKERACKLEEFEDAIKNQYSEGTLEYRNALGNFIELKNISNYSDFIEAYEYLVNKLDLDVHGAKKKL